MAGSSNEASDLPSHAEQPEGFAVLTLAQDELVAGRYRLIRSLGSGSSAHVWAALDETLGRYVAVKALTGYPAQGGRERERLRREARLLAALTHPRVTSVFDYFEYQNADGSCQPILVTELIEGIDLATRLRTGPLPPDDAVTVCAQVADALAVAHESGIVHRDVKPGNVMLTDHGAVLLDFGIARSASDTDLTGANVIGTPACMAPEQWQGYSARPESDVYALGCMLYWCLSGQRPYPDLELPALGLAHLQADAPPLPIGDASPQLAELYRACTAKNPAQRPSARVLSRRLAEQVPLTAAQPDPAEQPPQRTHRRLVPLIATGALVAAALAVPIILTSADGNSGGAGGSNAPTSPSSKNANVVVPVANAHTTALFGAPPTSASAPRRSASPTPDTQETRAGGASRPTTPAAAAGAGQPTQPTPPGPSAQSSAPSAPAASGQSSAPDVSSPPASPTPPASPSPTSPAQSQQATAGSGI